MSNFNISYDNAKIILSAFYNSTYRNVVGFVDLLHALQEEGTGLTLKQKIDIEAAAAAEVTPVPENNSNE